MVVLDVLRMINDALWLHYPPSSIDRGAWGRLPLTPFAVAPGAEANSFQERHGALRLFCSYRADRHLFGANKGLCTTPNTG